MPTENRSSNTEMVSVPFQRDDRYIVIKRSDLANVPANYRSALVDPIYPLLAHLPSRECLVIESDWPEYEPAWAAIERRVTGAPAPQPHPEPIAWMVGTAIWWTKEEAERDAAAMSLPVIGLGPMSVVAPTEQRKGEPVMRLECEKLWGGDGEYAVDFVKPGWLQECRKKGGTFLLYTHADPGEVERQRAVIEQQKNVIASLRAELVESRSIDASAEPSVPAALIPEGYCLMPRRLTAENGAKALLLGEFKLEVTRECHECLELDEPAEGCEICDGEGEYAQRHIIPWDKIKFIYSEAVKGLALQPDVAG